LRAHGEHRALFRGVLMILRSKSNSLPAQGKGLSKY
jgi:hypothetical protein